MPKVQNRYLADQVLHACGDVLKARRRENPPGCGIIPEVWVQSESMFVLYRTPTMNANPGSRKLFFAAFTTNLPFLRRAQL
jgi:hypothetical protein